MPVIINGSTGVSGTDGSASTPAVQGTDANTGMYFPAADQIAFAEGGVEAMRLDASGNVGIGATVPNGKLQVAAGASGQFIVGFNGTSVNFTDVDTNIFRPAAGTTESMRITAAGNVGIGTSSPAARLDVTRLGASTTTALFTTGVTDGNFRLGVANGVAGTTGTIQASLGLYYLGVGEAATVNFIRGGGATDGSIAFSTNGGTQRAIITEAGNVGIGTSSPAARLDVNGSIIAGTANGVSMFMPVNSAIRDTASAGSTMFFDVATGGATHGAFTFRSSNSFTNRMVIASNGDLQFNSGYGSVATAFGCRAWVNFNGAGTVAIRASGNVSSITDLGVGDYRVNFTNSMPDANYATTTGFTVNNLSSIIWVQTQLSSSVRIITYDAGAPFDNPNIFAAVFR